MSCDVLFCLSCCVLLWVFCLYTANIQLFGIVAKHIAENLAKWTAPGRRLQCKGTMSPVSFIVTGS